MKTFVLGDPHGSYKGIIQCFDRSGFDRECDKLIVLGDACDGWPETKQCIDELLTVKNLTYILGNHDVWALEWMLRGFTRIDWWHREFGGIQTWLTQGGIETIGSYDADPSETYRSNVVPESHIKFLSQAIIVLEDKEGRVFVHGGFETGMRLEHQPRFTLLWDRSLMKRAEMASHCGGKSITKKYDEIYVGHTTTLSMRSTEPLHLCELWCLDTGAGLGGKLTIMDVNTKEWWQSDFSKELYSGRVEEKE